MGEAAAKRKRGRPAGTSVPLSENPDRHAVAVLAAHKEAAKLTGRADKFVEQQAAQVAVIFVGMLKGEVQESEVRSEPPPQKGVSNSASLRKRPTRRALKDGCDAQDFTHPRNGRGAKHLFDAAERVRKTAAAASGRDRDRNWLEKNKVAWIAALYPDLARKEYGRDPDELIAEGAGESGEMAFWAEAMRRAKAAESN